MASANLFQAYLQPVRSVQDYTNDMDVADARRAALQGQQQQNALQGLQLRQSTQQMAEAEQDRNALQRIAAGWSADTTADQRIASLRNSGRLGLMTQADALEKASIERQKGSAAAAKDTAEADKIKLATDYMRRDRHLQGLANVTTPQQAADWIGQGVQLGEFSMADAQRVMAGLQSGQIPLDQWKQRAQQGGMTLQQQAQQRMQEMEFGLKKDQFGETQRHNKATEGLTAQGQRLADERAREQLQQGRVPSGYRQKPDGTMEFIPGGPADPAAAKKASPTEFQGKSAAFGSRAQEADRIITELEGKYSPAAVNGKQAAGQVWGIGGVLEAGANAALSPDSQRAEQAQRDFINAVLRQESGASIGASEFDNARRQYFPQPGDSAAVIKQKTANRRLAVRGLLNNAGNAVVAQPEAAPAASAASPRVLKFDASGNLVQ